MEHLYVFLSAEPIDAARILNATSAYNGRDKLILTEREAYLLCYESIRNAKLAAALGKPALGLTARNIGVMHKLSELLND